MSGLSMIDVVGYWIGIFLTLLQFVSQFFKDIAEAVGRSIG